jgi:hypothetical protein
MSLCRQNTITLSKKWKTQSANPISIFKQRYVRSTVCHTIHLQFDISANAFEIRALQSLQCIVRCTVDCTYLSVSKLFCYFQLDSDVSRYVLYSLSRGQIILNIRDALNIRYCTFWTEYSAEHSYSVANLHSPHLYQFPLPELSNGMHTYLHVYT